MKILFFLSFPNPFAGGAWTRTAYFANYFKSKGHQVSVSGTFSVSTLHKAGLSRWNGITIINFTPILMIESIFSFIFNTISSFLTAVVVIIFTRPQIIIISVPPGETALSCHIAAKFFKTKIVIDYRDEWEDYVLGNAKSRMFKRLYKWLKSRMTNCYLNSNLIITVTAEVAKGLLLRGIKNVKIITNGADLNVFKPYDKEITRRALGLEKDDFLLVYSGLIGLYYRLDIVVKALKLAVSNGINAKLLLVGHGGDQVCVLNLSEQMGLEQRVIYLGTKDDKRELAHILSASDVGIIPFDGNPLWRNALPSKALEYFACGIPVLATIHEDSLLANLIYEHSLGLVSGPGDIDALAYNMCKIFNDSVFVSEARRRALSLVQERYNRSMVAEELYNLLLGI